MLPPLYLHAAAAISPQQTFDREAFLQPARIATDRKLYALEADYRQYINPVAIRRMSRLLKMSITAAGRCLADAGWTTPDAIITGTSRGSLGDMESFLKDMIRLEEGALNPTLFIQSTYNAPNGWIALQSKCTGYNQTFVHRGHSLELALLDAALHCAETGPDATLLVGCYDELSEEYFLIKDRLGYWANPVTGGATAGEGTAFFALSGTAGPGDRAALRHMQLIHDMEGEGFGLALERLLEETGTAAGDIGLMIGGYAGSEATDRHYRLPETALPGAAVARFKHLSGEYDTSTGFALWLAHWLCSRDEKTLPAELIVRAGAAGWADKKYILLANHYLHRTGTLILLERL